MLDRKFEAIHQHGNSDFGQHSMHSDSETAQQKMALVRLSKFSSFRILKVHDHLSEKHYFSSFIQTMIQGFLGMTISILLAFSKVLKYT
jgi:hypothetical protein